MAIEIVSSNIDGVTGHTTYQIRVVEKVDGKESFGSIETVGIDRQSLMKKFHPDSDPCKESIKKALTKWLAEHYPGALQRKRHIETASSAIHEMKGTRIDF